MGITSTFPLAVDVACGTGHSTAALTALADQVIGFDISWNMLASADRNIGPHYVQARAESIPIKSGSVPIMSIALAFHWFNREQFLHEAWRVLGVDGLLLIYTNGFRGIMKANPSFAEWDRKTYAKRFPTPPRDTRPLTKENAAQSGFRLFLEENYDNEIRFSAEELVAYLMTQTNVVAAIDRGDDDRKSIHQWLLDQICQFFSDPSATFLFRTRAWYLKKQTAH